MTSSLSISLVAHEVAEVGGQELAMTRLAQGLVARGHKVTIVARRFGLTPSSNLRSVTVPGPSRPFALAYPSFFLAAPALVRREPSDIVHTLGALMPGYADVATVQFCHAEFRHRMARAERSQRHQLAYRVNSAMSHWIANGAEGWCFGHRRIGTLVPVSRGLASELRRWYPKAIVAEVIPNGVDLDRFVADAQRRSAIREMTGIMPEQLLAVFVGGDWHRKGLRFAIEALIDAKAWTLLVVGPGDIDGFRRLAVDQRVADRVRFVGPQPDTAPFYASADAFVLPTIYETFSLVTYEAASAGLPLLVSRVNGVEDIVREGENGWFITRDGQDIADRLNMLQANPRLRAHASQQAHASARAWGWDRVVDDYVALYFEILRGRREPTATPSGVLAAGNRSSR